MSLEEKMEMLENCMDLEAGSLKTDMELDDMDEWDSLSKLSLMAEAKKNFGKKLTSEEIMGFRTVQDILNFLQ